MATDLIWSVKNGDLDQVREHIESNGADVNSELNGRQPIHYAADYGQAEVIEYLIQKGANINAKDRHGITALLAAIYEGHTDCVKILLKKGASKEELAPDGSTYFDAAEKIEIKQLLK
ncbi:Uncharacterised protein g4722 [Pycnogonum litorale]